MWRWAAARPRGVEYDGGLLRCPAVDAHMCPLWRCCALFVPFAAAPVTAIACWPRSMGCERRSDAKQRGARAVRNAVARRRRLQAALLPMLHHHEHVPPSVRQRLLVGAALQKPIVGGQLSPFRALRCVPWRAVPSALSAARRTSVVCLLPHVARACHGGSKREYSALKPPSPCMGVLTSAQGCDAWLRHYGLGQLGRGDATIGRVCTSLPSRSSVVDLSACAAETALDL